MVDVLHGLSLNTEQVKCRNDMLAKLYYFKEGLHLDSQCKPDVSMPTSTFLLSLPHLSVSRQLSLSCARRRRRRSTR